MSSSVYLYVPSFAVVLATSLPGCFGAKDDDKKPDTTIEQPSPDQVSPEAGKPGVEVSEEDKNQKTGPIHEHGTDSGTASLGASKPSNSAPDGTSKTAPGPQFVVDGTTEMNMEQISQAAGYYYAKNSETFLFGATIKDDGKIDYSTGRYHNIIGFHILSSGSVIGRFVYSDNRDSNGMSASILRGTMSLRSMHTYVGNQTGPTSGEASAMLLAALDAGSAKGRDLKFKLSWVNTYGDEQIKEIWGEKYTPAEIDARADGGTAFYREDAAMLRSLSAANRINQFATLQGVNVDVVLSSYSVEQNTQLDYTSSGAPELLELLAKKPMVLVDFMKSIGASTLVVWPNMGSSFIKFTPENTKIFFQGARGVDPLVIFNQLEARSVFVSVPR